MFDYFKKLLPNFEKRKIIKQCDRLEQNIDTLLLPITTQTIQIINETNMRATLSPFAKRFEKDVVKRVQGKLSGHDMRNYVTVMNGVALRFRKKLDLLRKYVDELFANQVASSGLSFKQTEVLRLIDLGLFWFNYSMKLLHQAMYEECELAQIKGIEKPLSPKEMQYLNDNYQTYLTLTGLFAMKDPEFIRVLNETSDSIIAEVGDNVHLLGTNTDPFSLGFMPVIGDFILFVREQSLAYETEKYEANKLRLQSLQLQLQLMKEREQAGDTSETLKRQINYYTDRIKDIEYKIHEYERKAE